METEQQAPRQKIEAQAKADVVKVNADAEAYSTRIKAEAEAEANQKIAQSLTEALIRFTQVNRWNGELPQFVSGGAAETACCRLRFLWKRRGTRCLCLVPRCVCIAARRPHGFSRPV